MNETLSLCWRLKVINTTFFLSFNFTFFQVKHHLTIEPHKMLTKWYRGGLYWGIPQWWTMKQKHSQYLKCCPSAFWAFTCFWNVSPILTHFFELTFWFHPSFYAGETVPWGSIKHRLCSIAADDCSSQVKLITSLWKGWIANSLSGNSCHEWKFKYHCLSCMYLLKKYKIMKPGS